MSECNHDCSSCSQNGSCSSKIEKLKFNKDSSVKKVIGIISGKGGVGKSFTTSYLAVLLAREGYRVGIIDADITGPSIPYAFGIKDKAYGSENGIFPASTMGNIKIISSSMLLEDETDPIIWKGPMIGQLVEQFYTDVIFEELDFLLIDMPPGTGDVPLTVLQKFDVDGLILVTSPQGLVKQIVEKAAKMAETMKTPILGLVTNMSYVLCPKCDERIDIFGKSKSEELIEAYSIRSCAEVPFSQKISEAVEKGKVELLSVDYMDSIRDEVLKLLNEWRRSN